jgi:hypothetical protein
MFFNRNALVAQAGDAGNGYDTDGPTKWFTGRNVAHARRSKTKRAFLALDIARGDVVVVRPTMTQAARLVGVNLGYVHKAARMTAAERYAVQHGCRKIYQKPLALPAPMETVNSWDEWGHEERRQFVFDNATELMELLDEITGAPGAAPPYFELVS